MKKLFSVIIPIYKNEKNLPVTIPYIVEQIKHFDKYDAEIILVNDGSPDNSYELMKSFKKEYPDLIRIATLTRNFGQSAAMRCGMDLARGDVLGFISADLQDPFELFGEMLKEWENGYKVVIATRENREEKGLGVACSKLFHKIIKKHVNSRYPIGGFDFFLIDSAVRDQYVKVDLVPSSSQLLLLSLGYNFKEIKYTRKKRELGKSGYNLKAKIDVAIRMFVSWTDYPIKLIMFGGFFMMLAGAMIGMVDILLFLLGIDFYTAIDIILILSFFVGMLLLAIGVVGEYVWRVFEIGKQFPRYLIDESDEPVNQQNKNC